MIHLRMTGQLIYDGTERYAAGHPSENFVAELPNKQTRVVFEFENGKKITAELYPEHAPETVANFIDLVKSGFYDGLCFHRVIPGFMIQGGGFKYENGLKDKKAPKCIKGEFAMNGFNNSLKHSRGVISMARSMHPDSAGSQFFIMHADAPHLDAQYAGFGKLTDGYDVLDKIANVKTGNYGWYMQDVPREPVVIETIELVKE